MGGREGGWEEEREGGKSAYNMLEKKRACNSKVK